MYVTEEEREQMLKNGRRRHDNIDPEPVIKLFTPDAQCTGLLTELYPDDPTIAFGLCDLGMGFPELGDVSLTELQSVQGTMGLPIEKDLHFKADKKLSEYVQVAMEHRRIVA